MRSRDPLVLVPGGPAIPWPPQDDRLTERAREALRFSQDEAAALNHNHVGPVHLFAGLLHEKKARPQGSSKSSESRLSKHRVHSQP
jgi:ATP-dependent Clp protease ATP-binding subunit ClpA